MMRLGSNAATWEVRSLPRLRGRVGERVSPQSRTPKGREPSPAPSARPLPQAGEVDRPRDQLIQPNLIPLWLVLPRGRSRWVQLRTRSLLQGGRAGAKRASERLSERQTHES